MSVRGVDSAYPPTLAEAQAAYAAGVRFWGFYAGGGAALHTWTRPQLAPVLEAGITHTLPIIVPSNAQLAVGYAYTDGVKGVEETRDTFGVFGALVLDLESYMATVPDLSLYVARWSTGVRSTGAKAVVYNGAHVPLPAGVADWQVAWGKTPAEPGFYQTGASGSIKGVTVDFDIDSMDGFPFAVPVATTSAPTPTPITPTPTPKPASAAELAAKVSDLIRPYL